MKLNLSAIFYLTSNLMSARPSVQAQSLPHIFYENDSVNHTFVFDKEYGNEAFCEYDSCHLVLDPVVTFPEASQQWIAFKTPNATKSITYQICNSAGKNAVIFGIESPKCKDYSGIDVNVTSTLQGVTAVVSDPERALVIVNGTDSPYQIMVRIFSRASSEVKEKSENSLNLIQTILFGLGILLIATLAGLSIKYGLCEAKKTHRLSSDANLMPSDLEDVNPARCCSGIFSEKHHQKFNDEKSKQLLSSYTF